MAASIRIKTQTCCLCRISSYLFVNARRSTVKHGRSSSSSVISSDKNIVIEVDPVAMDIINDRGVSLKGHPGLMTLRCVTLPERLEKAADSVIKKYSVSDLEKKSIHMVNYLHARHPPPEEHVISKAAKKLRDGIISKSTVDPNTMDEEKRKRFEQSVNQQVMNRLRRTNYHWKPFLLDAPSSIVYLNARLAINYSIVLQCFSEIVRRDQTFEPETIFDLGSGLASSVWAGNKVWGSRIYEYYCVDPSRDVNTLARILLQDGHEQHPMHIPGVHFRQFMPSEKKNVYDLVVCAHTLLELPSKEARLETILSLWKMTEKYLVLIENGSVAGFKLINDAKEYIQQLSGEEDGSLEGHVFAPCPHEHECPKLRERNSPCMFSVTYKDIGLDIPNKPKKTFRYSYVILKKGKRDKQDPRWPRFIQEVLKPQSAKHVHCHLCFPSGKLGHEIFTARKHGKSVYKCARSSKWGDLFPVKISSVKKEVPDTETKITKQTQSGADLTNSDMSDVYVNHLETEVSETLTLKSEGHDVRDSDFNNSASYESGRADSEKQSDNSDSECSDSSKPVFPSNPSQAV